MSAPEWITVGFIESTSARRAYYVDVSTYGGTFEVENVIVIGTLIQHRAPFESRAVAAVQGYGVGEIVAAAEYPEGESCRLIGVFDAGDGPTTRSIHNVAAGIKLTLRGAA
jgi:hypothetical protein